MSDIIDWPDNAGKTYRYWLLPTPREPSSIKDEAGNYVFVKRLPNGNFVPLYFGVADSLRKRISGHDRWDDAVRAGATHIFSHTTPSGDAVRCAEERALIQRWNPPLNVQHRRAQ
jgi:hypothetical protein